MMRSSAQAFDWAELCQDNQASIRSSFVKTGFLIAKDGSEDGLIELWGKPSSGQTNPTGPNGEVYMYR